MSDTVPPPTPGASHTTTPSSDFRIIDKMKMNMTILTPSTVCFMTKTDK